MQPDIKPSFKAIAILFVLSFLVTSVFSASLKVFFVSDSWATVLTKGVLIPCFTWTVQLILSAIYLAPPRRLSYWTQLGFVCLVGSIALLPAAVYNLRTPQPTPLVSILNVIASVLLMSVLLDRRLAADNFKRRWALGWCALIVVNMSLYLWSISRL